MFILLNYQLPGSQVYVYKKDPYLFSPEAIGKESLKIKLTRMIFSNEATGKAHCKLFKVHIEIAYKYVIRGSLYQVIPSIPSIPGIPFERFDVVI